MEKIIISIALLVVFSSMVLAPELDYMRMFYDRLLLHYAQTLPYFDIILEYCYNFRVDVILVLNVIKAESGFKTNALSHKGAIGLMQIHPLLAKQYGFNEDDLYIVRINLLIGIRHLSYLLNKYKSQKLALMCYLCGEYFVYRDYFRAEKISRSYIKKILGE